MQPFKNNSEPTLTIDILFHDHQFILIDLLDACLNNSW